MKRYFTVYPKHWWWWLSPSFHRKRKILQAYMDAHQEEFLKEYQRQYRNLLLYGCSIDPQEFYGQEIVDRLLCKHESTWFDRTISLRKDGRMRMADICNDCGEELP